MNHSFRFKVNPLGFKTNQSDTRLSATLKKLTRLFKIKRLLGACLILLAFNSNVYALQSKEVDENAAVSVTLSQHHKTRVSVVGERIQSVHGTPQAYAYVTENSTGELYLLPAEAYYTQPFTLFITTEQAHHYQLNVTTRAGLGDTILLRPKKKSLQSQRLPSKAASMKNNVYAPCALQCF